MDTNNSLFAAIPENLIDKIKLFRKAIKYLCKLKDPASIVADQQAYEALFYLQKILTEKKFSKENHNWDSLIKFPLDTVLIDLFVHITSSLDEINIDEAFKSETLPSTSGESQTNGKNEQVEKPKIFINKDARKLSILDYVIIIIYQITTNQFKNDIYVKLNDSLFQKKLLQEMLNVFSLKKFLDKKSDLFNTHDCIVGITGCIWNMSENPFHEKTQWKDTRAEDILKNFKCRHEFFKEISDEIIQNINRKSLKLLIQYLLYNSNDASKILDSFEYYSDILFMQKYIVNPLFNEFPTLTKYQTEKVFVCLLSKFHEHIEEFEYDMKSISYDYPNTSASQSERRISIMQYILMIILKCVGLSVDLNVYYGSNRSIQNCILNILGDEVFIEKSLIANSKVSQQFLTNLIFTLYVLSKYNSGGKTIISKLEILLSIREKLKSKTDLVYEQLNVLTCATIGNYANELEMETMKDCEWFVKNQIVGMVSVADSISNGNPQRKKAQFLQDNSKKILKGEVCQYDKNNNIIDLLNNLKHYAVTLTMKKLIYQQKDALKTIILQGNEIERLYALRLLSQLCYSEEISKDIKDDTDLTSHLVQLGNISNANAETKKECESIIWLINRKVSDKINLVIAEAEIVSEAEQWSIDGVKKWLTENQFHEGLIKTYAQVDGHMLKQLYNINKENPQFFHQSLMQETNNEIKLSEMTYFISKLKKLFEN